MFITEVGGRNFKHEILTIKFWQKKIFFWQIFYKLWFINFMLMLIVTTISYKLLVYCKWYSLKSTVHTVIFYRWHLFSYLSIIAATDTQHNPYSSVFLTIFYLFNCFNFLNIITEKFIKVLFCRYWAKEKFKPQLKILKAYVALGYHFKGLFSTVHCEFSWHQFNENSTQFYSQFGNFFP